MDEISDQVPPIPAESELLFSAGLANFSIAAAVLYVGAFAAGILWLRPIVGMLVIIASVWFLWWLWQRGRSVGLNVDRLGMILAVCFLLIGGLLGIFLGLAMAGKLGLDGSRFAGSHPAFMVAGYLVLGGVAVAEWCLEQAGRATKTSRAGVAQVILFSAHCHKCSLNALLGRSD